MRLRRFFLGLLAAASVSGTNVAMGQQNSEAAAAASEATAPMKNDKAGSAILTILAKGLAVPGAVERTDINIEALSHSLESPQTENRLLDSYLARDHGWQFLRDVNFKIKAFQADATHDTALGFSYDYQKSIQRFELECSDDVGEAADPCTQGLDLSLSANGNVAFDSERNPNDFLESALSFAFFQSVGGVSRPSDADFEKLDKLRAEFIAADTEEAEEAAVAGLGQLVRPVLTDQFYWEVAGDVSLESDQKFDGKQFVYGVHTVFEVKGWSNDSPYARFNIFDYPFAALRALTGYETCNGGSACFIPRGTSWPTVLLGFARVSPPANGPRALAGATDDFDRMRVEVSVRTPIARVGEDRLYVSANYRYYKELDPPDAVRRFGLDSFGYCTVVLGGSEGVYVSFTDGRLPLDAAKDRVFELGYQFHLK